MKYLKLLKNDRLCELCFVMNEKEVKNYEDSI